MFWLTFLAHVSIALKATGHHFLSIFDTNIHLSSITSFVKSLGHTEQECVFCSSIIKFTDFLYMNWHWISLSQSLCCFGLMINRLTNGPYWIFRKFEIRLNWTLKECSMNNLPQSLCFLFLFHLIFEMTSYTKRVEHMTFHEIFFFINHLWNYTNN